MYQMQVVMPQSKYMYLTQIINSLIARNEDRIKFVSSQECANGLYLSTFLVIDLGFVFNLAGKFARADPLLAIYTLDNDAKRSIYKHPLKLRELDSYSKSQYHKHLEDLNDDERVLHDYLVNLYSFYI